MIYLPKLYYYLMIQSQVKVTIFKDTQSNLCVSCQVNPPSTMQKSALPFFLNIHKSYDSGLAHGIWNHMHLMGKNEVMSMGDPSNAFNRKKGWGLGFVFKNIHKLKPGPWNLKSNAFNENNADIAMSCMYRCVPLDGKPMKLWKELRYSQFHVMYNQFD